MGLGLRRNLSRGQVLGLLLMGNERGLLPRRRQGHRDQALSHATWTTGRPETRKAPSTGGVGSDQGHKGLKDTCVDGGIRGLFVPPGGTPSLHLLDGKHSSLSALEYTSHSN